MQLSKQIEEEENKLNIMRLTALSQNKSNIAKNINFKRYKMENRITIKGARQHNLKNINLDIPKNKLIVFTGLSGSGKSTLAFDTIFAEGQRRYVESLSAYAR